MSDKKEIIDAVKKVSNEVIRLKQRVKTVEAERAFDGLTKSLNELTEKTRSTNKQG